MRSEWTRVPRDPARPGIPCGGLGVAWVASRRPTVPPKTLPKFHLISVATLAAQMVSKTLQNGSKIGVTSCQEPSETLLEPGCRAMRFSEALGSVLGTPGTSKVVLPLQCGPNFR